MVTSEMMLEMMSELMLELSGGSEVTAGGRTELAKEYLQMAEFL